MTNKVELDKGLVEVLKLKGRVLDAVDTNEELVGIIKNRDNFLTKVASVLFTDGEQVTFDQILEEVTRLKENEYSSNVQSFDEHGINDHNIEEAEFSELEADEEYVDQ